MVRVLIQTSCCFLSGKGKSKKTAGGSAEAGTQNVVTSSAPPGGGSKPKQPQSQPQKDSAADKKKVPSRGTTQESAKSAAAAAELELPLVYLQSTGYLGHVRACPIDRHAYPVHPSLAVPAFTLVSN